MRLTHLAMTAAVAGAMATPLALAAPASATADGFGRAYGISASGLVNIPSTPSVESSSATPARDSVLELPSNPLIEARVLGVDAVAGHARASVADVKLVKAALSAELITAECKNGKGVSRLVKLVVGGKQIDVTPKPNTSIAVNLNTGSLVQLTLNKQVRNSDGSLTVTAVELGVGLGHGKSLQKVSISSATCKGGHDDEQPNPPGTPNPDPTTPPGEAPAPTPVPGDLPVTG
jgi:hypothetical protein